MPVRRISENRSNFQDSCLYLHLLHRQIVMPQPVEPSIHHDIEESLLKVSTKGWHEINALVKTVDVFGRCV